LGGHYEGFASMSLVVLKSINAYTARMCLITFKFAPHTDTPLTMVANRDEFHARESLAAQIWEDNPHVLAGIDVQAGGTWMGVTREGYFAAITNVRSLPSPHKGIISRGQLVCDFLKSPQSCEQYLKTIHNQQDQYDGFNLIVGNREQCWYLSNHNPLGPQRLAPGLYGLSNAQLDTRWPKVAFAKQALKQWLQTPDAPPLYTVLNNTQSYPKEQLPHTGISEEWESLLSPAFIVSPAYGTRASTGLCIHHDRIEMQEASFNPQGRVAELLSFKL
jgi:uncharacterized protein with NRDE domain